LIYRFPDTPELEDLTLDVEVSGGRIHFSARGKGRLRCAASLALYFGWLNSKKPIRTHEGLYAYSLHVPPVPSAAHARQLESFLNTWLFRRRRPMAATLALTDDCQCSCVHCSAAMRPRHLPALTTSEWKRVIDECLQLGVQVVTFTGGEPLLRPDLEELVAYVPPDRAIVEFFSNGLALTEERLRGLKAAGAYGVQLSLDSFDPDSHDAMRGFRGAFQAVETSARTAVGAGLLVGISTYASNGSVDERRLTKLAALAAEWGACEISVFDAIRTGRMLRAPSPLLDAGHRWRLLLEARRINHSYGRRLRVVTQSWTNSGLGFSWFLGCLASHFQLHISAQGDFMPCDFTPLSFGNVREASVADLWAREAAHPAYRRHSVKCRMQSPEFRAKYIDTIPEGASLPYPIAGHEVTRS
jgi:MoaA/NifB/PqqE/SkfB family radical SAM enzyme